MDEHGNSTLLLELHSTLRKHGMALNYAYVVVHQLSEAWYQGLEHFSPSAVLRNACDALETVEDKFIIVYLREWSKCSNNTSSGPLDNARNAMFEMKIEHVHIVSVREFFNGPPCLNGIYYQRHGTVFHCCCFPNNIYADVHKRRYRYYFGTQLCTFAHEVNKCRNSFCLYRCFLRVPIHTEKAEYHRRALYHRDVIIVHDINERAESPHTKQLLLFVRSFIVSHKGVHSEKLPC